VVEGPEGAGRERRIGVRIGRMVFGELGWVGELTERCSRRGELEDADSASVSRAYGGMLQEQESNCIGDEPLVVA
jgi:hypothetical protein